MPLEPIPLTKSRKRQLEIFKTRVKPKLVSLSEGVNVKLRNPDNARFQEWDDKIVFEQPKLSKNRLPSKTLWDYFYEKELRFWSFNNNPLINEQAFLQELHDRIVDLKISGVGLPIRFRFVRPKSNPYKVLYTATEDEKFEDERYPHEYRFAFTLVWVVK
jgi:hypothetical protein